MTTDSFMRPEVYKGTYYAVETTAGTEIVPTEVCGTFRPNEDDFVDFLTDYCEGDIDPDQTEPQRAEGYLYRLSAPGYLDCTSWGVAETEDEARDALQGEA